MNLTLSQIAGAMGTSVDAQPGPVVTRVSIDSRSVLPGDLYFCIHGRKLDGHEFARQAVDAGACAVVASTPLELSVPVLMVRDTTAALGRLARFWREGSRARVIGVTGSAGKTTVKEMLAMVLGTAGVTAKNFRNLNNQIGLPLSILEMTGEEDFWVLELGISQPGDMDELGYILSPDAAVIINVGPCHLEGLGSLGGVAAEKTILLDHVRPGGFACINIDYPELEAEAKRRGVRMVAFSGQGLEAAYTCQGQTVTKDGFAYAMAVKGRKSMLHLPAQVHVRENVMAVTAVATEMGLDEQAVSVGLAAYSPVAQRFVQTTVGSWIFIDDTYNANPVSMSTSIVQAAQMAKGRRLVLVLGEMRELGDDARRAHRELGRLIASTQTSHCFFYGDHAESIREGLGTFSGQFTAVTGADEVLKAVQSFHQEQGIILFKGSRSCKMENFYSYIERNWA